METQTQQTQEQRRERRLSQIREIFTENNKKGAFYLAAVFNQNGFDNLAEAVERHQKNLEAKSCRSDYILDPINLRTYDKFLNLRSCFPEIFGQLGKIWGEILYLSGKRDAEIAKLLEKLSRNGNITMFGVNNTPEEIKKGQENLSGRSFSEIKDKLSVTPETYMKREREIISRYDPQIEALCEDRERLEEPIKRMISVVDKYKFADNKKLREMNREEYRLISRAYRLQKRILENKFKEERK
jgi:hypothetical protein